MVRVSKKKKALKLKNLKNISKRYPKPSLETLVRDNDCEVSVPQDSSRPNVTLVEPSTSSSNSEQTNSNSEQTNCEKPTGFALYTTYNEKVEADSSAPNYMFVDLGLLSKFLCSFPCPDCFNKTLSYNQSVQGYASILHFECESCGYTTKFETSQRLGHANNNSSRPPFDINRRMVHAFISLGKGHRGMETFGMYLNMKPIQKKSYSWHMNKIHRIAQESAEANLEAARCEVRKAYMEIENLPLDYKGPMDISVSYDGSWQKRGFTSKNGVGCCVEVLTGMVIDYEVLTKYCRTCEAMKSKLETADFETWFENHKSQCKQNYEGSSPNMEVVAAERLWQRSEKYGFRYTTVVSDGDSKTFSHLTELNLYGDTNIEKVECLNHVAKRLGTGLRKVVADNTGTGEPLGGKKHGSLKGTTIDKLTAFYRNAIQNNLGDISKMKTAIFATLDHCSSTDSNPKHSKCPKGSDSWCFFNRAKANNEEPASHATMLKTPLNKQVLKKIIPLYARLSTESLLAKCVSGKTQNANESLHGVIWSKCPKTSFFSRTRLEIGVCEAICQYNTGCIKSVSVIQTTGGISPGSIMAKIAKRFDEKRLKLSKSRKDMKYSEYKRKKKQAQLREEERRKEAEGLTYGAGEF